MCFYANTLLRKYILLGKRKKKMAIQKVLWEASKSLVLPKRSQQSQRAPATEKEFSPRLHEKEG